MGDKLKLSILDLMTILLPGGFLLIFLRPYLFRFTDHISMNFPTLASKDVFLYAGFLALAYITGSFVNFFASFLDDWIYENVAKVFYTNTELTAYIIDLKIRQTGIADRKTINAFKWSSAWLLKHEPAMYESVERLVAESKFFRSLILVSFASAFLVLPTTPANGTLAIALFILSFFSTIRYLTQRKKSITTAYEYVLTAFDKKFDQPPPSFIQLDLERGIIIPNNLPKKTYESRKYKIGYYRLTIFKKKLVKVLQLCLNPFYKYPVSPIGQPDYGSSELRWFTREQDGALMDWFDEHAEKEERTDIYFIDINQSDIGIKIRKDCFEIKQKAASLGPITLNKHIVGTGEYWRKWIVGEKDAQPLKAALRQKIYKQIKVEKTRWAVKLTFGSIPNGPLQPVFHPYTEQLSTGFQLEYTVITIGYNTWYTFAVESFGSTPPQLSTLQNLSILNKSTYKKEDSQSYPQFLGRLTGV